MLLARPENSEELFKLAKNDEFFSNEGEDGEGEGYEQLCYRVREH